MIQTVAVVGTHLWIYSSVGIPQKVSFNIFIAGSNERSHTFVCVNIK